MLLKNYVSGIVFIMIRHYTTLGITRAQYEAETTTTNSRTEWRRPILTVQVTCERGTTFAKQVNIKAFMNW